MDSQFVTLRNLIDQGKKFTFQNFCCKNNHYSHFPQLAGEATPEWFEWTTRSYNLVIKLVMSGTPAYVQADQAFHISTQNQQESVFLKKKELTLRSLENTLRAVENDVFGELRAAQSKSTSPAMSNKIFIVHGHDQELKNDAERFVQSLGLVPIVLHRQVDSGNTIIEKFEKHSDVGYAIILLTPDEIAYSKDQHALEDNQRSKEWRARPNVIFEFGYFAAKLGRRHVCCLHKGEVVIPSDLQGLVYKKISNSVEEQAMSIIRELMALGYKITLSNS